MLPLSVVGLVLAFRFPAATEIVYSQGIYPWVVRGFALVNRQPSSWAELLTVVVALTALWCLYRFVRSSPKRWGRMVRALWGGAGIVAISFVSLWGLNYARPSLASRLELEPPPIEATDVLRAGERTATITAELYRALESDETPTVLPYTFEELNHEVDLAFEGLALPGDTIDFRPTPAKPLRSSELFSHLGISGIFIPFTGEPSVNVLQPAATLPIVVAHEKAHQHGVTNEGEANFAAFLACSQPGAPVYLRYSAYLFATRYLLGAASAYLSAEEVAPAWELLGDGPLADLRAIRDFWEQYQGAATEVASRVNDGYLRAMQVPGGVQSYGTVVTLLMAVEGGEAQAPQTPDRLTQYLALAEATVMNPISHEELREAVLSPDNVAAVRELFEESIAASIVLDDTIMTPELGGEATLDDGTLTFVQYEDTVHPIVRRMVELRDDPRALLDYLGESSDGRALLKESGGLHALLYQMTQNTPTDAQRALLEDVVASAVAVRFKTWTADPETQARGIASTDWKGRYVGFWHIHPARISGTAFAEGIEPSTADRELARQQGQFLTIVFQPDGFDVYDLKPLAVTGSTDLSRARVIEYRSDDWNPHFTRQVEESRAVSSTQSPRP